MTYNPSMFQSIRDAIAKSETTGGNPLYKEILKFKVGNTYVLRLLPNINTPQNTFYHFYTHGWNSFTTGQYVSTLSLQTIGQPDPISKERYRLLKNGTLEEKAKAETVKWQEQWYVNVYVVDDPVNPENNGTVKIFRYGKMLDKMIKSAIEGDDSDEFGARVFDLSPNGVNFKLKVEKQGEWTSYNSSRFTSPADLGLSEERIEEIYGSVHDLTSVNQIKSESEIVEMWNTHFLGTSTVEQKPSLPTVATTNTAPAAATASSKEPLNSKEEISDEMVEELLKGLN
jgi:hypothetical protein